MGIDSGSPTVVGSGGGGDYSHHYHHALVMVVLIMMMLSNGNRTEWSPIRSVIIRVINKIGRPCT